LSEFPKQAERAAAHLDPSVLVSYLYDVSRCFSRFYHDCPILAAGTASLARSRLDLVRATRIVLKNAMELVLVPFLEVM
jgi:arginyl-tRNA synthetase